MGKKSGILTAISLCVISIVVSISVSQPRAIGTQIVPSFIEEEIQRLVFDGEIPSLHLGVVSGSELIWVRGFGAQTSNDIVFLIGSIQKVLVAISVLQLYEKGRIDLDDDVNDYLPFTVRNPTFPNVSVTISMLLSHRSGLAQLLSHEFCYDWEGLYYPDFDRPYYPNVIEISLGEFLSERLAPNGSYYSSGNWVFEPGTDWSYSNSGYKLLMFLLETVSNQTISEYMKKYIFEPLRMPNTGFNALDFTGHHAIPHTRVFDSNIALPVWNGQYMMRSTVSDLGHLIITLMNEGQFEGFQLLQPETIVMMRERTHSHVSEIYLEKELRSEGYGLGLEAFSHGIFGHGGSTIGFTGLLYFNPIKKLGYIMLSNVNSILGGGSEEWQALARIRTEIRNLVMINVGLLPPFDFDDVFPWLSSILLIATVMMVIVYVGWYLRKRRLKKAQN
jgi:CubicO group peptidase (beta-lactamase class C family)